MAIIKHIVGVAKNNKINNLVKFKPATLNFFPLLSIYILYIHNLNHSQFKVMGIIKLLWFIFLCQALLGLYILTIM